MNSSSQEVQASEQFQLVGIVDPTTEEAANPHVDGASQKAAHSRSKKRKNELRARDRQLHMATSPEDEWTDQAIWQLRLNILECLHELGDGRLSDEEEQQKQDWIAWVAAPLHSLDVLATSPNGAFSFQTCCLAIGADPEASRDHFLERYAPEKVPLVRAANDRRVRTLALQVVTKRKSPEVTP